MQHPAWQYHYSQLPEHAYAWVHPEHHQSQILLWNHKLAENLGLDTFSHQAWQDTMAGKSLILGMRPLAQKYVGHQFGVFNPDLGDGRGMLLGEWQSPEGQVWDIHLKGAGQTPFSRRGDGKAVLRSSIREFLASEYLAALGVPSTRALALSLSDEVALRDEGYEPAARILRLTPSHIRFGHVQYFAKRKDINGLKQLLDLVIVRGYPQLQQLPEAEKYPQLFAAIVEKTAKLLAHWQGVGFYHGVMNSDNMSILGETFDFGPYSFMQSFRPEDSPNHTDHLGRYAFNRQPSVALWNLERLAESLISLIPPEKLEQSLMNYYGHIAQHYQQIMTNKLGLSQTPPSAMLSELIQILQQNQLDYSHFFHQLKNQFNRNDFVPQGLKDHQAWWHFWAKYQQLCQTEDEQQVSLKLQQHNPSFCLRTEFLQKAIDAAHLGDFQPLQNLYQRVQQPFAQALPTDSDFVFDPFTPSKPCYLSCSS